MPFEMECAPAVARMYWRGSPSVRREFDKALDEIAAHWTKGSPDLREEEYPLQSRRFPFSEGVLIYRYEYDEETSPKIIILAWRPHR
jgi:hypothetical protein